MNKLCLKHSLFSLSIVFTIYIIIALFIGFYYGWLDDLQEIALFSGLFLPGPQLDPVNNVLVSNLMVWLYSMAPDIAWYGIFMHFVTFLSLFLLFLIPIRLINSKNIIWGTCILICFTGIHVIEMVAFFNCTYVSMLAMMAGLTFYLSHNGKIQNTIALALIVISILIRTETALYIGFFVVVYELLSKRRDTSLKRLIVAVIFITAGTSITKIYTSNPNNAAMEYWRQIDPALKSIQDAYNITIPEKFSTKDSLILESLKNWSHYDKYAVNKEFVERVAPPMYSYRSFAMHSMSEIQYRLKEAYSSSMRYPDEYSGYNWRKTAIGITCSIFAVVFLLLFYYRKQRKTRIMNFILAFLLILLSIVFIAVFIKIEYRIIYPVLMLAGYWLSLLLLDAGSNISRQHISLHLAVVVLMVTTVLLTVRIQRFTHQKKEELNQKREIIDELNTRFDGKTFIYDMHAVYMMHDNPFKQIQLSGNNNHMVAAHYWLAFFPELQEYYKHNFGSDRIDHIIASFYENADDYIFVGHEQNMVFLSKYLDGIYDKKFNFKKLELDPAAKIKDLTYSYMWFPIVIDYYVFESNDTINQELD